MISFRHAEDISGARTSVVDGQVDGIHAEKTVLEKVGCAVDKSGLPDFLASLWLVTASNVGKS